MSKQKVIITGASGLIGSYLIKYLSGLGYDCIAFTTHPPKKEPSTYHSCPWHPEEILTDSTHNLPQLITQIQNARAIINLAGASIAKGRLGSRHKKKVLNSRIQSTSALVKLCQLAETVPQTWIQASAIGYYGDTHGRITDESGDKGSGFLSDVCNAWEACLSPLNEIGNTHIAIARLGLVLSDDAPAWRQLIFPIKWGLGGPLGSGNQWWSWIHLQDIARAFVYFIKNNTQGVYNLTAPYPLQQKDMVKQIGNTLKRPTFFKTPELLLKIALGNAAKELVLCDNRVCPKGLIDDGFQFTYPKFEDALSELLDT